MTHSLRIVTFTGLGFNSWCLSIAGHRAPGTELWPLTTVSQHKHGSIWSLPVSRMLLTFLISCKKGASNNQNLHCGLCWELETLPAWLSPAAAWREAAHTGHVVPRGAVAQRAYQCQTRVVIAHIEGCTEWQTHHPGQGRVKGSGWRKSPDNSAFPTSGTLLCSHHSPAGGLCGSNGHFSLSFSRPFFVG